MDLATAERLTLMADPKGLSALKKQSTDPAIAGFRIGAIGSLWLLGLVHLFAIPAGVGAAVFLEEYVAPGRIRSARPCRSSQP